MSSNASAQNRSKRARVLVAVQDDPDVSVSKLARSHKVTREFASKWKHRIQAGDDELKDAPRSGRPCKLSAEDVRKARRHLGRCEHSTIRTATALINQGRPDDDHVSVKTVRRHLVEATTSKLKYREPVREKVSAANQVKRRDATNRAAVALV